MTQTSPAPKTRWHILLGALLDALLTPVDIEVSTNVTVMSTPPEADILLLRRDRPEWSAEQLARLPDGIRESSASHILLEFKYTESLNEQSFRQALGYDYFYRQSHELSASELQTVVVSSKTPRTATLKALGYAVSNHAGVYQSRYPVLNVIMLLSLNELANTLHNAPIKCFASRKREKQAAFTILQRQHPPSFPVQFWWFIKGLLDHWLLPGGGDDMSVELTPERVIEMGKKWEDLFLAGISVEKRLAGLKPEERLAGLKPEERLAGLKPEEIERYLRKLKGISSNHHENT
jgi:hypothetical protein